MPRVKPTTSSFNGGKNSERSSHLRFQNTPRSDNKEHGTAVVIRPMQYLSNIVEQDHCTVKRGTQPLLGFKSCNAARRTLVGIALMPMLKQKPWVVEEGEEALTAAEQF
jgi:putative transposase